MTQEAVRLPSFGRRMGRQLKGKSADLYQKLLPQLRITLPDEQEPVVVSELFSSSVFPLSSHTSSCGGLVDAHVVQSTLALSSPCISSLERKEKHYKSAYWLEIGFGGGEHLAKQAENHRDIGMIGCEPFMGGVGRFLLAVNDKKLDNVRIWDNDVRMLLDQMPDNVLERVFILFPDPWPKKKHWKRRLIAQPLFQQLARVMKPGGELRIATDHVGYSEWITAEILKQSHFTWRVTSQADWKNQPDDWVKTRYQQKAADQGREPVFFRLIVKD